MREKIQVRNALTWLLFSFAVTACAHERGPLTLRKCDFASPSGEVYNDRPHQWFGRATLLLLNNGDKRISKVIVDVTPWVPSWEFWVNPERLAHHWITVRDPAKARNAAVTYELTADDYTYLVDIKWETDCTIVSVTFADGTTWTNPLTLPSYDRAGR